MFRLNWLHVNAMLVLLAIVPAVPAAPVPAENSLLEAVPAAAPVVVHLRGAEGTKERLVVMLTNALPELAPTVESYLDAALKNGAYTDGRKLRGVAKNGPLFLVFNELPKPFSPERPKMALLLALTKYEDFRDNVLKDDERKSLKSDPAGFESAILKNGEPIFFVNKKSYVVVTPSKETAIAYTRKQKGLNESMSKEQSAKFLAGDIAVYLNMDSVKREYADQINQAKTMYRGMLNKAFATGPKNLQAFALPYKKLVDTVFQAFDDSQSSLLTVEFRPKGLALHIETEWQPGSQTAKALKDSKLSAFKGLNAMPAGQMQYFGYVSGKSMAMLDSLKYGASFDPDDKETRAGQAAIDELVQSGPGTCLGASNPQSRQSLDVCHFRDPVNAVKARVKLLQALVPGSVYGGVLKDKPKLTPKAEKYGDFEFTGVELTWDLEKMAENKGNAPVPDEIKKKIRENLEKMLGTTQMSWLGTDGKIVVQVMAKDWVVAKKLLDHYFNGQDTVAKLTAFQNVRQELPSEASMIYLFDVVRSYGSTKSMFENVGLFPFKLPPLPANASPAYIGMTATLKSDRGSFDLFISPATLQIMHDLFKTWITPDLKREGPNEN